MGSGKYILDKATGKVSKVGSLEEWEASFKGENRVIGSDHLTPEVHVSTVFLSLDHGDGPPILFETMVFHGNNGDSELCVRYATMAEAIEGHKRICRETCVQLGIPPPPLDPLRMWLPDES